MNNMQFPFVVCLAVCALTLANAAGHLGESKLLLAMRTTTDLQQSNPARSLACFQYYSEVFDQLLKTYEQDYENCQTAKATATSELDELYNTRIGALNNTAVDSCQMLTDCVEQEELEHTLDCYKSVGSENMRVMYNISSYAGNYYAELRQRLETIQFNENQCTNTSKRNYELNTDREYINLQSCLSGEEDLPSKAALATTEVADQQQSAKSSTTSAPIPASSAANTPSAVAATSSSAPATNPSLSSELKKLLHSLTL